MKLTYLYHSGFVIEGDSFSMIIDYFRDSPDDQKSGYVNSYVLNKPGPLYVLSSHSHADHFNSKILDWKKHKTDIRFIFSKDILDSGLVKKDDAVFLDKLEYYKDDMLNIEAFGSTDLGISFLISAEDKRIFHAGDLNNWHWNEESTEAESQEYERHFLDELAIVKQAVTHVDLAMFPLDARLGKDYARGASQFLSEIDTGIFVPMHFDQDYESVVAFAVNAEAQNTRYISLSHEGESIDF